MMKVSHISDTNRQYVQRESGVYWVDIVSYHKKCIIQLPTDIFVDITICVHMFLCILSTRVYQVITSQSTVYKCL